MPPTLLPPSFSIRVQPARDRVVVALAGELDLATAPGARAEIAELIDAGFSRVVIDLRDLEFLDSTGLHLLVDASRRAIDRGCALSLIRGPAVHRIFELTGLEGSFTFEPRPTPL